MRRTKPELKVCPLCEEKVGLSAESVKIHTRLKHPDDYVHSQASTPVGGRSPAGVASPLFSSPTAVSACHRGGSFTPESRTPHRW